MRGCQPKHTRQQVTMQLSKLLHPKERKKVHIPFVVRINAQIYAGSATRHHPITFPIGRLPSERCSKIQAQASAPQPCPKVSQQRQTRECATCPSPRATCRGPRLLQSASCNTHARAHTHKHTNVQKKHGWLFTRKKTCQFSQ